MLIKHQMTWIRETVSTTLDLYVLFLTGLSKMKEGFNEIHINYGSGKFSYSLKTSSHTCTKENPKYTKEKVYM